MENRSVLKIYHTSQFFWMIELNQFEGERLKIGWAMTDETNFAVLEKLERIEKTVHQKNVKIRKMEQRLVVLEKLISKL